MSYMIHTLGKELEYTDNKEEALWTLASRYGGAVLNAAQKNRGIYFSDEWAKVNPVLVQSAIEEVNGVY